MLTYDYTYAAALEGSLKHEWTVDDCYRGRDFDFTKPFLPDRIAGVRDITCLDDHEKLQINQIRANAYCHLFAFVEEEVKHQELMGRANTQFAAGFGVSCDLVPGREAIAEAVLSTSPLAALLLTS